MHGHVDLFLSALALSTPSHSLSHTHTSVRYQDPRPSSDDSKRSSNRPWAFSKNRPWALFEQAAIPKCHFRVSDEGLLAAPGMSGRWLPFVARARGNAVFFFLESDSFVCSFAILSLTTIILLRLRCASSSSSCCID